MALHVKGRTLFHLAGGCIVGFWLVMIVFLVLEAGSPRRHAPAWNEVLADLPAIDAPQREWKEIFLQDKKVGYAVSLIKPVDSGFFIQEEIFLKLNLMGKASPLNTVTQCRTDNGFRLENFLFTVSSGLVQFRLMGRRDGHTLVLETGRGIEKRAQTIPLEKIPIMAAGVSHFFKTRPLMVGEAFSLPIFDPSTMAQRDMMVRVLAKEPLLISRITYDAFRLETEVFGRKLTVWVGEDGEVLKEDGFMGLTTVKSSAAKAPQNLDDGGEGADLYEITAVRPDRGLPNPNRLKELKVQISGLENGSLEQGALNGNRQEYRGGNISIRKEKIVAQPPYAIPYADQKGEMKEFLASEWNIESDDQEIRSKVAEILGKEKNPAAAAAKLLEWVYRNLEKKPVLSLPSALETLRTRVGDCNEHATLLTALLRAAGIPARLSIGLAYSRDRFYYHAWTEAYLGDWVSMDATLNQMPADPAHIKLVEGNMEKQVEIAGMVGQLKMKVVDFQYE